MKIQAYNSLYSFLGRARAQRLLSCSNVLTYAEKALSDYNTTKTAEQSLPLNFQRLKSFISG